MSLILELGTTDYTGDRLNVKRAMSHMETLCGTPGGYTLGEPKHRAGWAFFKMRLSQDLHQEIESRFADMMERHRWVKPEEKFCKFLEEYLQARGCGIRLKLTC